MSPYHTEVFGKFRIEPCLSMEQVVYLRGFAQTLRVRRDPELIRFLSSKGEVDDSLRLSAGIVSLGAFGEFFVPAPGAPAPAHDPTVIETTLPPNTLPCLTCPWLPTQDGAFLVWSGNGTCGHLPEWLCYMLLNFFYPWDRDLVGSIYWQGDDCLDLGIIHVDPMGICIDEVNTPDEEITAFFPVDDDDLEDAPLPWETGDWEESDDSSINVVGLFRRHEIPLWEPEQEDWTPASQEECSGTEALADHHVLNPPDSNVMMEFFAEIICHLDLESDAGLLNSLYEFQNMLDLLLVRAMEETHPETLLRLEMLLEAVRDFIEYLEES